MFFLHSSWACSDNRVGDEGARALAESLKQNATLTQLRLESMSWIRVRVRAVRIVADVFLALVLGRAQITTLGPREHGLWPSP